MPAGEISSLPRSEQVPMTPLVMVQVTTGWTTSSAGSETVPSCESVKMMVPLVSAVPLASLTVPVMVVWAEAGLTTEAQRTQRKTRERRAGVPMRG